MSHIRDRVERIQKEIDEKRQDVMRKVDAAKAEAERVKADAKKRHDEMMRQVHIANLMARAKGLHIPKFDAPAPKYPPARQANMDAVYRKLRGLPEPARRR